MRNAVLILICLCASFAMAQDEDPSVAAWKKLSAEYNQARSEYYKPYYEARKKGETFRLDPAGHPDRKFAPRYKAFTKEHEGSEGALLALNAMLRARTPDENVRNWALTKLLADYIESESLANSIFAIRNVDMPKAIAAYRVIAAKSTHPRVRGLALLQWGTALKGEEPEKATVILRKVVEAYADEQYYRDRKLGPAAEGAIFEIERLAVDMEAPEIVGEDLDGQPMKLSEFRGKVVLLDFWGDW